MVYRSSGLHRGLLRIAYSGASMSASLTDEDARAMVAGYRTWYHRIEVRPGIVTPGVNDSPLNLRMLDLPADCSGMRVLDLGARDGFFSFELERRGADVVAVDYVPAERTGFLIAAQLLGSRVVLRQANLYHLTAAEIGTFDLVLFLGLLYHLPDPIRAIRIARGLCTGRMYLETLVIDDGLLMPDGSETPLAQVDERLTAIPLMQFFPGRVCNNDPTNYWGPNVRCVEAMLAEAEFRVERVARVPRRAVFQCAAASSPHAYYLDAADGSGSL
jgi:tRNA (mo5U34)-methyltransferase